MGLIATLRNAFQTVAFDLGRQDGALAQAVVMVNPGTGLPDGGGQAGVRVTTDTSAITGKFTSITILADASFSVLTEVGATGDAMTGFLIPAGVTIFGQFTAYTLTSGKVRAYL